MPATAAQEREIYRAFVGLRTVEQVITELNDRGVLQDHHSGLGEAG